jgi:hypothetical protein
MPASREPDGEAAIGRSWSDLQRDDPDRVALELANAGTNRTFLVYDVLNVPELREQCALLKGNEPALLRLALWWFGDQGHPQPYDDPDKYDYPVDPTPRWEHLPRLDDDEPAEAQPAPVSNDPPGVKKHPGPEETFHEPLVIREALVAKFTGTYEDAMSASGLNDKDVARVERMHHMNLWKRDGEKLVADPVRVRQRDGKIALKVLSDDGTEWLDPLHIRISRVSS